MNTAKIYRLYGINTAMELLRPNAKWEISNREITRWEDPRPQPTWDEIDDVMAIWLPEDWARLTGQQQEIERAIS